MKFHWPSFLIGIATGAAAVTVWTRFRPALVEIATAAYEAGDALWTRAAGLGEDAEDLLAEAQAAARARGARARQRTRPRRRGTRTAR
jgi:hypothetical protein